MPKYIITTVSTFVHKYAIEAETAEHATDEWVMLNGGYEDTYPDCCEILQKNVSEDVAEVREATDEQIVNETDEYMKGYALERVRVVNYD
jgi:hypothetical protein